VYKFILVASELDGHAQAASIIASDAKEEQDFRNYFLTIEGKPNASLEGRRVSGDSVVEHFSEIEHFFGNFCITTITFYALKDIQNRMVEVSTG